MEEQTSEDWQKFEAFLADYMAVCRKHNLGISSCGCCDSPWVGEVDVNYGYDKHFREQFAKCGFC